MCLHPKISVDLLDRPLVNTSYCTFTDNCDYLSVENLTLIEPDIIAILQLNLRGLYGKIDKLKNLLNDSFIGRPPDILLLCETWMSANSPDIRLPGYNKFECRQTHKRGGGVCIFVNELLSFRTRLDLHLDNVNFEHCLIEVKLKRHKLIVGSLYQAPNIDQAEFIKHYDQLISNLKSIPNCDIVLGMDHNLDFLKSHTHSSTQ